MQEIFIELWKHAGRFDPSKGSETTFIATIARRRALDALRRRTRRPETDELPEQAVDDSAPEPGLSAERSDEFEQARRALQSLPETRRNVLTMAVLEGATHTEISQRAGLPLGTVKTHVRRGLIRLREMLDRPPGEAGSA